MIWLYGEALTVSFAGEPLAQYTIIYQPARRHLVLVAERECFETPYDSLQSPLWELTVDDWLTVIRMVPYAPQRPCSAGDALQPSLFPKGLVDEAT